MNKTLYVVLISHEDMDRQEAEETFNNQVFSKYSNLKKLIEEKQRDMWYVLTIGQFSFSLNSGELNNFPASHWLTYVYVKKP